MTNPNPKPNPNPNLPANAGGVSSAGSVDPWVRKIPWRRKWQPTPVFLPGESHGQRSLAGYSPEGCKGSDTTERPSTSILTFTFSR